MDGENDDFTLLEPVDRNWVLTRAVAAAPRGGSRCPRPPDSSPLPNFVFSGVFPLTGSTHLFGLCRSHPVESVQPVRPSPAETTRPSPDARPVPPRLGFGLECATQFAPRFGPATAFRGPASLRGPAPACLAQLAGPAPIQPICTVQTASSRSDCPISGLNRY
ncbi:hypothetical protein CRG98_039605 [Punica granatum]|uniref:Uncharacterized protein n=1 Tax=Punica granatum TaxID=22663 RepID=A0A2I0I7J0_PUNGR|nr:hypothetical protein CRG98_039605 [Punica granatum]